MTIDRTNALLNVADRIISVLRANINTLIADVNSGNGEDFVDLATASFTLPTFQTAQISLGDPSHAPPMDYPAIRCHSFVVSPTPIVGRSESRGSTSCQVRIYVQDTQYASSAPEPTIVASLERKAMAMAGVVQSVIEDKTPGASGIYSAETLRVSALPAVSDRINPALVKAYELTIKVGVRMRFAN